MSSLPARVTLCSVKVTMTNHMRHVEKRAIMLILIIVDLFNLFIYD